MSRNHLVIELVDASYRVRDANSSNGTFVNNTRIASWQLCSGDFIQAGESVFKVRLQESIPITPSPTVLPQSSTPNDDSNAPARSLTLADNFFDDKQTKRFRWNPEDKINLDESFGHYEMSNFDSLVASPAATVGSIPSKFHDAFPSEGMLLKQHGDPPFDTNQILESMIEWEGNLSVIVNLGQISHEVRKALGALDSSERRMLSRSLCIIEPRKKTEAVAIYAMCLGLDAAICVGCLAKLPDRWLRSVANTVSFPSMLYRIAAGSPEKTELVTTPVDFMLFESEKHHFCLLTQFFCQQEAELSNSN